MNERSIDHSYARAEAAAGPSARSAFSNALGRGVARHCIRRVLAPMVVFTLQVALCFGALCALAEPGAQAVGASTSTGVGSTGVGSTGTRDAAPRVDWRSPPALTLRGLGSIRIGMTPREIAASAGALRTEANPDATCYFTAPLGAPEGIALMIADGRLARIDITSASFSTRSGARVGHSQRDILQRYGGRLEIQPHKYKENSRYLVFVPADSQDREFRMIFETDGAQVTMFSAGRLPEVEFVEGCN